MDRALAWFMLSIAAMRRPRLIPRTTSLSNVDASAATGGEPPNWPTVVGAANASAAPPFVNERCGLWTRVPTGMFAGRTFVAPAALWKCRRSRPFGSARAFASDAPRIHRAQAVADDGGPQLMAPVERCRPQPAPFASLRRLIATAEQVERRSMSRLIVREILPFLRIRTPLLEAKRP